MQESSLCHGETNYRSAIRQKKKVKCLSSYVYDLLEAGHVIEARYFVDKLLDLKPNHPKALKQAYEIAIKMNDHAMVKACDQKLLNLQKVPAGDVISLQVEYYVKNNAESALCNLSNEYLHQVSKLEDKTYKQLLQFSLEKKNFMILFNALNHLRKSNLSKKFSFKNEQNIKKILVETFAREKLEESQNSCVACSV